MYIKSSYKWQNLHEIANELVQLIGIENSHFLPATLWYGLHLAKSEVQVQLNLLHIHKNQPN